MAPRAHGAAVAVAVVRAFITWLLVADVEQLVMLPSGSAIAVDLGNTNACVAGYTGGDAQAMFHLCIPSWVAFRDDSAVLVGEDARDHAAVDPQAAVSGFKRLLGRRFDNVFHREFIQRVSENLPHKIVEEDMNPQIEVKAKDGVFRHVGVDELTAALFARHRDMAEARRGGDRVHAAVVPVPAQYVGDPPRQDVLFAADTTAACTYAMWVLDEPVAAAAAAYGLHRKLRDGGNAVVLHVGGAAAARHVEFFFGGDDFDHKIMDYFIGLIRDEHGRDIGSDTAALMKLRTACEHAKKTLSDQDHVQVIIESLVDGVDLSERLTRAKFEGLCHDLFVKVVDLVDRVMLQQAELKKNKDLIDEIVFIGGRTMIPKIRELIKGYFDGKELNTKLKPDEAVALGGALLSHHTANGYPCMGVDNRHQIGGKITYLPLQSDPIPDLPLQKRKSHIYHRFANNTRICHC
ncbi:hypothetical protein ACP4OV_012036 [Aristida adscensionis]